MAIKSIKLKLYFSRTNTDHQIIWHTHGLMNKGVSYYLRHLLLLRQQPIIDIVDPQNELLRLARTAQAVNGKSKIGTDEEILAVLRNLYQEIIPASVGKKSNAQVLSRAYLSTLVDPKSIAGLGLAKKKKEHKPDEPLGNSTLIDLKNKYGILPLFSSFSDSLTTWQKRSVCTTWDRDMFQQSIERMCSWESWNIRIQIERKKLAEMVAQIQANNYTPMPEWAEKIRRWEEERKKELNVVALPSDDPYRIRKSGIRGWRELRQVWRDEPNPSKEMLIEHIADVHRELHGSFGDPAVFSFLAQPDNHCIWNTDVDNVTRYVEYNELLEKLARSKQQAQFTLPDAIKHPVWIRLDGPGGNLHWYEIEKNLQVSHATMLMLACIDNQIVEKEIRVPLARSLQWQAIQITDYSSIPAAVAVNIEKQKNDTKVQWVQAIDKGTRKKFIGKLGGAKIQFERNDLEKAKYYLDTYINISINYVPAIADDVSKAFTMVKPDETSAWTVVDIKPEKFEERQWLGKQICGLDGMREGLRVMAVALKLKTLAVCSIYEVVRNPKRMAVQIAGTSWYAEHKSSFILSLPGEKESKEVAEKRKAIQAERIVLRNKLKKLSKILSLAGKKKETREDYVKIFRKSDFSDETILVDKIMKFLPTEQEEWQKQILAIHREFEHDLGKDIEAWRKKYRRKSMELRNVCGLSLWWIQELVETRKLINAWSAHARSVKEIVRARSLKGVRKDLSAREVDLDARLLDHINNIKEDRTKKGADMIVMHALGYRYNSEKAKWTAQHPPCRLILFRDMSEFKMNKANSKRDNARLMAWAHRSLPKHVASQGEIYGLLTGIVRTNHINQWHARNGSPGVRMIKVEEEYITAQWFTKGLLAELTKRKQITKKEKKAILELAKAERTKKILKYVQIGQWIPWEHGTAIVTLDTNKDKIIGNALVNITQITQRLFWLRQLEINKLYCTGSDKTGWVPIRVGKRLEATMGFGRLVKDDVGYHWEELQKKIYNKLVGQQSDNDEEFDEEEVQELSQTCVETSKQMFFRDPSGIFFDSKIWLPALQFWTAVEKEIDKAVNPSTLRSVVNNSAP